MNGTSTIGQSIEQLGLREDFSEAMTQMIRAKVQSAMEELPIFKQIFKEEHINIIVERCLKKIESKRVKIVSSTPVTPTPTTAVGESTAVMEEPLAISNEMECLRLVDKYFAIFEQRIVKLETSIDKLYKKMTTVTCLYDDKSDGLVARKHADNHSDGKGH